MKKMIKMMAATLSFTLMFSNVVMGANVKDITTADKMLNMNKLKLAWSDEFEGTELNSKYWTPEEGNGYNGWGNNELQYYTKEKENLSVADGKLSIIVKSAKNANGNTTLTSARIKTQDKVLIGDGYVEAKIKLPSKPGIWPAFWMLGNRISKIGWPRCGEIDIMESWNVNTFTQYTLHYADGRGYDNYNKNGQVTKDIFGNVPDKTQWHTYGVYRNGTTISFYYDGKFQKEFDTDFDLTAELNTKDYFVLLNVACGGNLTENTIPNDSDLPCQMDVDYVRYYTDIVNTPKKTKIKKAKNIKKKTVKLTLKKVADAKGYAVKYATNKKFKKAKTAYSKKTVLKIKKLKKNKKYFFKAAAYNKNNGKKYFGKWSAKKSVKIKK